MTRRYPPRTRHKDREDFSIITKPDGDILAEVFLPLDQIAYVHTVFAQCFLPYQAVKHNVWQVDHGQASVLIGPVRTTLSPAEK